MGYVKRKGSNAGKITMSRFEEVKEEFLADVKAEVLMNGIPPQLVFNWDQTAIHYMSQLESGPCIGKQRRSFP